MTFRLQRRGMTATLLIIGALAASTAALSFADDDDDDDDDHGRRARPDVAPVTLAAYQDECGACHFAYQPGLLPSAAWQRIMRPDALADHFGDDASLEADVRAPLARYLDEHAADRAKRSRSKAFAVGADNGGLPRITERRYFRNEHHEIPTRLVSGNPEVGSFSRCEACHTRAEEGVYDEHAVRIPGHGRWDD
jgi:hypothetical protein